MSCDEEAGIRLWQILVAGRGPHVEDQAVSQPTQSCLEPAHISVT